ncbi:hypothetical protein LWC08_03790 [Desulfobaculum bizertense]|uniref:hypothetical protein n=1 Tax=Desulfobaculum bizertense TaxID=376490 RepID=UPI001F15F5A8|nr:hypothetical protein [Desulfobaculum bizertense]UIJ38700.1 hypothetical protein LWC08_03790 [Desulfobaculum bizertense]
MNSDVLERELVREVERHIDENNLSHSSFAAQIFTDEKHPAHKWRRIRRQSKGKPQHLTIAQGIRAAEVLGLTLPQLLLEAEVRLKAFGPTPEPDPDERLGHKLGS